MAVSPTELAKDFVELTKTHFQEDPDVAPLAYAEEFSGSGEFATPDSALTG